MEDDDVNDVDSLFEGMDFVMALPSHIQLTESIEAHEADSRATLFDAVDPESISPPSDVCLQRSSSALPTPAAFLNKPLDEGLFCGLDISVAVDAADVVLVSGSGPAALLSSSDGSGSSSTMDSTAVDSAVEFISSTAGQEDKKQKQGNMEIPSFESIMAAYDDSSVGRGNHLGAQLPRSSNIRRKKRSMKIGYGRETGEYEEETQNKSSERTEPASTEITFACSEGLGVSSEESEPSVQALNIAKISQVVPDTAKDSDAKVVIQPNPQESSMSQVASVNVSDVANIVELRLTCSGTDPLAQGLKPSPFLPDSTEYQGPANTKLVEEDAGGSESVLEDGLKNPASNVTEHGSSIACSGQLPEKNAAPVALEAVFGNIISSVSMKLQALDDRRTSASSLRKAAVRNKRLMAEEVSAATAKLKEVESQLEYACEREDFERADVLSEEAKEAEIRLDTAFTAFRVAEAGCDFAAEELQRVWDLHLAIEEEGIRLLRSLQQEAEEESRSVEETVTQEIRKERGRLTAEEEALELKKNKATEELRVFEEASQELRACIENSIAGEMKEKSCLKEKQEQLDAELQSLLLMVKDKEKEIADNNEKIAQVDNEMAGIISTFENRKEQLEAESEAVYQTLIALEKESEHLAAQKTLLQALLSTGQEQMSTLLHVATTSSYEAARMQRLVDVRRAAANVRLLLRKKEVDLAKKESHALKECQSLRKETIAARTAIQELSGQREKIQQEIGAIKVKFQFVEKRGPELESEKRLAASSRNFKEAARLAAEAKVLVADKEAAAVGMQRYLVELEKLEREVEAQIRSLANIESCLAASEKDASVARCERLRLLAAATRDERDAAAELEDFSEAESLDAEAEALDAEANELKEDLKLDGPQFDKLSSLHSGGSLLTEDCVGAAGDEAAHVESDSPELKKVD